MDIHAPICQICGKPLLRRGKRGPKPRFTCSPECHRKRTIAIRAERHRLEAEANPRLCTECGKTVTRGWSGGHGGTRFPKTCSPECRQKRRTRQARLRDEQIYAGAIPPGKKNSKDGYVRYGGIPVHRIVMARARGRQLERWEVVHHRNGKRDDNRPENLELWIKGQPAGQRVEDQVAFLVEHYRDLVVDALG